LKHGIDFVSPKGRFARSVNVERDAGAQSVENYLPTGRALDVISRVARCLDRQPRTRAFSITGPYGTGKSSLAVFLDALLGPADAQSTQMAMSVLRAVDPVDSDLIDVARDTFGSGGFVRAVVTASREPVAATLLRGLLHGLQRFPVRGRATGLRDLVRSLSEVVESMERRDSVAPSNRFIRDTLESASQIAPVLVVIDEFGKNLEAFAGSRSEADLYLLQELVEWSHTPADGGNPVVLVTMQHLAFEEYLDSTTQALRREWAKVQGRFEDIPYVDTPNQTRHLIAQVQEPPTDAKFIRQRGVWAAGCMDGVRQAGLGHELDRDLVERSWPLHPTALLALPELCARYGQNERTLFSFLASAEPLSVPSWLVKEPITARLKDIRLDRIYDYFVDSAATSAATSQTASRWVEVETAVRDATGITAAERRVLKSIGLLNLISAGGAVRASRPVLRLACVDGQQGTASEIDVDEALDRLESSGRVTYREFADEFRLWRGSDLDLRTTVEAARRRLRQQPVEVLLARSREMLPLVAARHSTETGTLRVFERAWDSDGRVMPLAPTSGADGLLVYVIGTEVPSLTVTGDPRPVVAVRPANADALVQAALEVAAIRDVLEDGNALGDDWVARRELGEREAEALAKFDAAFEAAVGYGAIDTEWWLLAVDGDGAPQRLDQRASVTAALSSVCDIVYAGSPPVPNEMLNRHELTSQGAKARRLLIEGLLTSGDRERFGIAGFPPERAMYDAVFGSTGIHRQVNGRYEIVAPQPRSWSAAWQEVEATIARARTSRVNLGSALVALSRPPIGLKAGVGPVLLVAAIVANRHEVALYEHGTYRPRLTPDVAERLLRNPAHFEIKHFAATSGPRREVLEALAQRMDIRSWRGDPPTVLSVVAHLVAQINGLTDYGKSTRNLTSNALAVRRALLDATEPDTLLFDTLPAVFALPPVPVAGRRRPSSGYEYMNRFASDLEAVLGELQSIHKRLLDEIEGELAVATRAEVETLRVDLAERARRLTGKVLDIRLRSLLASLADAQKDRESWLEYVAMTVAGPAAAWDDDGRLRFLSSVRELGGTLRRIEAINFERLADDGEPFDARRWTATAADGSERARIVAVDDRAFRRLGGRLKKLLDDLTAETGSRAVAVETVLAGLDEEWFTDEADEVSHPRSTVATKHPDQATKARSS
jgi:hypothetical protein